MSEMQRFARAHAAQSQAKSVQKQQQPSLQHQISCLPSFTAENLIMTEGSRSDSDIGRLARNHQRSRHRLASCSGAPNYPMIRMPQHDDDTCESPLPPGWSSAYFQGKRYFINQYDNTTTWVDPRTNRATKGTQSGQSFLDCDLPEGWEAAFLESGTIYYIDHINKRTTWTDPRNFKFLGGHDDTELPSYSSMFHLRGDDSFPSIDAFPSPEEPLIQPVTDFAMDTFSDADPFQMAYVDELDPSNLNLAFN